MCVCVSLIYFQILHYPHFRFVVKNTSFEKLKIFRDISILYMCVYVCMCACVCVYACMRVSVCMCACMDVYVCVRVYVCMCACMCVCMCVYVCACMCVCALWNQLFNHLLSSLTS